MKIKSIIKNCVTREQLMLFTKSENQYISDGRGFYPLEGLPELDFETICTMFDISQKKREKIHFNENFDLPTGFNINSDEAGEVELQPVRASINIESETFVGFTCEYGTLWVEQYLIEPLADLSSNYLRFYRRKSNNNSKPYIIAKNGLMFAAMILPHSIATAYLDVVKEMTTVDREMIIKGED